MKLGGIESKFNFQFFPPTPRAYKPQNGGKQRKKIPKVSAKILKFLGHLFGNSIICGCSALCVCVLMFVAAFRQM